jgi:hypothetical protein
MRTSEAGRARTCRTMKMSLASPKIMQLSWGHGSRQSLEIMSRMQEIGKVTVLKDARRKRTTQRGYKRR